MWSRRRRRLGTRLGGKVLEDVLILVLPFLFSTLACAADSGAGDNNGVIRQAQTPVEANCLSSNFSRTKLVTHYVIPILKSYDHTVCDQLEGTCIYDKKGTPWLHNFGYNDQALASARCKNGYGNQQNCLHPCRILAASQKYHPYGQIIFMKELVGKKCGNLLRDGYEMIHDGYMVVQDTGSPRYFNQPGRFDFFWGRCQNYVNGECLEGAAEISEANSYGNYCVVWDPNKPAQNAAIRDALVKKIKDEALRRGDLQAAQEFEITSAPQPWLNVIQPRNDVKNAATLMRRYSKANRSFVR